MRYEMKFLRLLIPAVLLLAASIILAPIVLFSQAATFLPTINIVPKIVPIDPNTGEATVELDAEDTVSDSASGEILLHEWDLNDDGMFDDASTVLVSHVFRFDPVPQGRVTRVVRLRATDAEGNAAVGIYEIEFQTPPAPPHPDAGGPYTVEPGGGCRLDASSSYDPDPEEYISKVEWDLDGDGRFDVIYDNGTAISNPATLTLDLTPADLTAYGMTEADAAYPVTLKITDSNSQSSETTATITILASSGDSQEHGKDGGSEENTSGDLDAPFSLSSESADSTLPTAVLSSGLLTSGKNW